MGAAQEKLKEAKTALAAGNISPEKYLKIEAAAKIEKEAEEKAKKEAEKPQGTRAIESDKKETDAETAPKTEGDEDKAETLPKKEGDDDKVETAQKKPNLIGTAMLVGDSSAGEKELTDDQKKMKEILEAREKKLAEKKKQ